MTADAELAVAWAGSPPPGAVLEVLQVPVLVLGPSGQLVSANAAARRLLRAKGEAGDAEGLLRALAHEARQAKRPMEREIAVPGLHRSWLRARVTPLDGGAAVELAVTEGGGEPGLAARLAQRIRDDSIRLVGLVGGAPGRPGPAGLDRPGRRDGPDRPGADEGSPAALPGPPAVEEVGRLSVQDVTLDVAARTVWVRGQRVDLPFKEFEVLRLLLEHAGRVVPRQRLIERVWGRDFSGDPKTLDVHVKRLRAKIEADRSRPTRIVTVRQIGYRFDRTG